MTDKPKKQRGGKRSGAGRPATGKGEILPYRFRPGTIARIEAAAAVSGRSAGETARDALDVGLPAPTGPAAGSRGDLA